MRELSSRGAPKRHLEACPVFFVVLNEEVLPEPYGTAEEASNEAERLAREFEAKHCSPASWVIAEAPHPH